MTNGIVVKAVVLCVSGVLAVLGCELLSRIALNPADFLSPRTIKDDVLGITVAPHSSGFDEWGFRNSTVPAAADVVAVGDSHTYGNTAKMEDAWPSVVASETKLQVYNMGLGGYGPNQYFHLLRTKGLKLHPKWVLCGLYLGDDFENAFLITYGLDHWAFLRKERWDNIDANIWGPSESPVWGANVRNWLSEHSMVYRIVFHGPLLAMLKEAIRFREAAAGNDPFTTALVIQEEEIQEAFRPIGIAERLDPNSPPVKEGMRITMQLLAEMNRACKQEGCRFLIIIIPTKEMVFSEYIESNRRLHLYAALQKAITNERTVKKSLVEFFALEGMEYLDALPALKQSLKKQLYAKTTRDMHPGKNGYRVIGHAVADYMRPPVIAVRDHTN